jgi:peptide chain release factor subunit 1
MNEPSQSVLILTPVKNADPYLDGYFERLAELSFPHEHLSLGMLESDSSDGTWERLQELAAAHAGDFRELRIFKHDFGFHLPPHLPRWEPSLQLARRNVLARSRNQLLFRALGAHDWVLWLDVDVVAYPHDLVERLLAHDLDILHPDCVRTSGGESFDHNAWAEGGAKLMHDLRGAGRPVRIDSVGGTVLLVRADLHRDGLVFPPFRYGLESPYIRREHPVWGRGEIETEGFAAMARDMGLQCWGLPDLEVVHA